MERRGVKNQLGGRVEASSAPPSHKISQPLKFTVHFHFPPEMCNYKRAQKKTDHQVLEDFCAETKK